MGSIGSLVIDPRQIVKPIDDKDNNYQKQRLKFN